MNSRTEQIEQALALCNDTTATHLATIFRTLWRHYGVQQWWPGDGPFEVAVGAVLTQNTAWSNVEQAIARLQQRQLLDPQRLADLPADDVADAIRPSGYFNVKAKRLQALCRWWLAEGGFETLDRLPTGELRRRLLEVHGIGPESADDILLYAFDRPVFVIDTYTRRIMNRLDVTPESDGQRAGYEEWRGWFEHHLPAESELYNEFHALIVLHAKLHCRSRPLCHNCPLKACRTRSLPASGDG